MIPGNWKWYLSTYKIRRSSSGEQQWARLDNPIFEVHAYDVPRTLDRYPLNAVEFTPACALRYCNEEIESPDEVRWGIVTCLRDTFIKKLGPELVARNFFQGSLVDKNGKVIEKWIPVVCKNHFSTGLNCNAVAYLNYLAGGEVYDDNKYVLILREDVFTKVIDIKMEGCNIYEWAPNLKTSKRAIFKKWKR